MALEVADKVKEQAGADITVINYRIQTYGFMHRIDPGKSAKTLKKLWSVFRSRILHSIVLVGSDVFHLDDFDFRKQCGFKHHKTSAVRLIEHFISIGCIDIFFCGLGK